MRRGAETAELLDSLGRVGAAGGGYEAAVGAGGGAGLLAGALGGGKLAGVERRQLGQRGIVVDEGVVGHGDVVTAGLVQVGHEVQPERKTVGAVVVLQLGFGICKRGNSLLKRVHVFNTSALSFQKLESQVGQVRSG